MEKGRPMPTASTQEERTQFVKNSVLYKEFLAEREEILRHKWIESEKAGADIGFEKALLDWIVKHRSSWREKRRDQQQRHAGSQPEPSGGESAFPGDSRAIPHAKIRAREPGQTKVVQRQARARLRGTPAIAHDSLIVRQFFLSTSGGLPA